MSGANKIPTSFCCDVKNFAENHKVLSILTLGLAIVAYSIGNLASRSVTWLSTCLGTTKKVNETAQERFNQDMTDSSLDANRINSNPQTSIPLTLVDKSLNPTQKTEEKSSDSNTVNFKRAENYFYQGYKSKELVIDDCSFELNQTKFNKPNLEDIQGETKEETSQLRIKAAAEGYTNFLYTLLEDVTKHEDIPRIVIPLIGLDLLSNKEIAKAMMLGIDLFIEKYPAKEDFIWGPIVFVTENSNRVEELTTAFREEVKIFDLANYSGLNLE